MPITLGSNIASLSAQRQLGRASDSLSLTYERLSSGQRISRASDDAAGLAIADNLRVSTRVYTQATRNINDGISYLNIAQGALSALSEIVLRQKELAEQAANGIYSPTQKAVMQKEANTLVNEYNRIMQSTSFNNIGVLNGSNTSLQLQQGFGNSEATNFSIGRYFGVAAGDATFNAGISFATGSAPIGVTTGDFNGDGNLDFATADVTDQKVSVFLGNGNGTFNARLTFAIAASSTSIVAADLDNDGRSDLVVTNSSGTVEALIANADGSFQLKSSNPTGNNSRMATITDFNGDGILDMATADRNGGVLSVYLGNGNGTFKARTSFADAGSPVSVTYGDFNGDGIMDLASGANGASVGVFLGNGDGTFRARQSYATGSLSSVVSAADLNGDGNLDLISANTGGATVGIFLGNGDGTFGGPVNISTGASPVNAAIGDYNGDGKLDIIAQDINRAGVFLGNGDGTFSIARSYSSGGSPVSGVAAADFNKDGVIDLLASNNVGATSSATILLGNSDGTGRRNNFLSPFSLITQQGARSALDVTTDLLNKISLDIGLIGANQSRLSVALNTINVRKDNYQVAESQIRDVDIASESSALVRSQILQQAASAILGQANLIPQLALQLLNGR